MKQTIIRLLAFLMIFSLVGAPTTVNAEPGSITPVSGRDLRVLPVHENPLVLPFVDVPSNLDLEGFAREFSRWSTTGRITRSVGLYSTSYDSGRVITYNYGASIFHGYRGTSKLCYYTPTWWDPYMADNRPYYEFTFNLDTPNAPSRFQGSNCQLKDNFEYSLYFVLCRMDCWEEPYHFYGTLPNGVYYQIDFDHYTHCTPLYFIDNPYPYQHGVTDNFAYTFVVD